MSLASIQEFLHTKVCVRKSLVTMSGQRYLGKFRLTKILSQMIKKGSLRGIFPFGSKLPIYTWKLYIFSESGLCKGESVEGRDNEL